MDRVAAKQFLVSRVIAEAKLEGVPLSDVETKMLHFTEVHPSLPDIYDVYAEFERDYDGDQYEKKVVGLLKNARDSDQKQFSDAEQQWKDALNALRAEDHYILVMTGQAFGFGSEFIGSESRGSRFRDFLIYISIGVAVVLLLFLWSLWTAQH
jgi:hypothetical protein